MNAKFDKESLIRTLEDFGVPDPEYWAEEELRNDFPWLAAFRFLTLTIQKNGLPKQSNIMTSCLTS